MQLKTLLKEARFLILATFKQHANREVREEMNILLQKGFSRMYIQQANARNELEDLLRIR